MRKTETGADFCNCRYVAAICNIDHDTGGPECEQGSHLDLELLVELVNDCRENNLISSVFCF